MADGAVADIEREYLAQMRIAPERLAWSVLLLSFATFCVICAASTLFAHFFLFQSSLSLETTLQVGRGTVGITESATAPQAETQSRQLSRDTAIRTDSQDQWSQAVLSFRDPETGQESIVTAVLKNDTSVFLRRANRPRFSWSSTIYEISLQGLDGEIDIRVANDLPRPIELSITTVTGDEVLINRGGNYLIDGSSEGLSVVTRTGEAIIISADRALAYAIPGGQQATFNSASQELTRTPYMQNLLVNNQLQFSREAREQTVDPTGAYLPPFGWSCTNGPVSNLPVGNYFEDTASDGRRSFRLVRGSGADTNGYTRCDQSFGDGLDVSTYDSLYLRSMFYVDSQSLNGCGQEGSECPMMFRIRYKFSPDGDRSQLIETEWVHGLYTVPLSPAQETAGWKRQCGTCLQPHIRILGQTWYVYESGNLFDVIPDERRPVVITQVEFFAEGHQYDVFVDDVSLLAWQRDGATSHE